MRMKKCINYHVVYVGIFRIFNDFRDFRSFCRSNSGDAGDCCCFDDWFDGPFVQNFLLLKWGGFIIDFHNDQFFFINGQKDNEKQRHWNKNDCHWQLCFSYVDEFLNGENDEKNCFFKLFQIVRRLNWNKCWW